MNETQAEKFQKLLPNEAVRNADRLEDKNADSGVLLKSFPLIKCECGFEILLLPDLQAMNRAISAHAAEHEKKERNAMKNTNSIINIRQMLSQLTVKKISEQNEI